MQHILFSCYCTAWNTSVCLLVFRVHGSRLVAAMLSKERKRRNKVEKILVTAFDVTC